MLEKRTRIMINGDVVLKTILTVASLFIILLLFLLGFELYLGSIPSINGNGISFLTGTIWDPSHNLYGALPFVYGTLLTSAIALLFGLPVSIGVSIFLTEKVKMESFGRAISNIIELLAAIPSVIFGLWGLFVLKPFMASYVEAPLHNYLGFLPFFEGTPFGLDFLTAGIILAIMVIPTISSITKDILKAVPASQKEAMYSLGATSWEVVRHCMLPYAKAGIFGAAILGLGRAIGETMAVTMVIGNKPIITPNLFSPGYTMASVIANEFFETSNAAPYVEIGLILLFTALTINIAARLLLWGMTSRLTFRV